MHEAAYNFVAGVVLAQGLTDAPAVLDLGGRVAYKPAGTIHGLFSSRPRILDALPGEGVDIVADAADWTPDEEYDVVLCTEVFEHTDVWWNIVVTAYDACRPGGMFIATCARGDRPPHAAATGGALPEGEFYENVDPAELTAALSYFRAYGVFAADGYFGNDDLYCWAVK